MPSKRRGARLCCKVSNVTVLVHDLEVGTGRTSSWAAPPEATEDRPACGLSGTCHNDARAELCSKTGEQGNASILREDKI